MNQFHSYQETLDYLFAQLPMYQRIGDAAIKIDLRNISALAAALNDPHLRYPSIHIAGTNGKGSVAHFLSAVLQAAGMKVGLYTSPHYKDFRERIKINGKYISRRAVVNFVQDNKDLFDQLQPSFFEITVAMAFWYFAQQRVEVAVVETGLGGRLDSTNILNPVLSIITNISLDHQQFLGHTPEEIAFEKAGIIKKGVPVVVGTTQPETKPVFERIARERKAPLSYADEIYSIQLVQTGLCHRYFDVYKHRELVYENLELQASGAYQCYNLATVLQSLDTLPAGYTVDEKALRTGLSQVKTLTRFFGRWQILRKRPMVICDSAHNEAGIRTVMAQVMQMEFSRLHIVLGVVKDKPLEKVLPLFPVEARYYFAKADIPRGQDAKALQHAARSYGLLGRSYTSVKNAYKAALRHAEIDDLIFVGGSVYTVAEII